VMALWTKIEERYILFTILFFVFFRVCDAPIRFFLVKAGLGPLSSLPNILILGILTLYLFKAILTLRLERRVFWVVLFFGYAIITGCLFVGNIKQILLGLYGLLPVFFGAVSCGVFTNNFERLKLFIATCWLISVIGVFLAVIISFPWVGFSYERLGMEMEGSREWASFGITRIAGFSRTSYDAAVLIFILMIMLGVVLKRRFLIVSVFVVSGAAIVITTTKTIIGVFLLIIIYLLTRKWYRLWSVLSAFLMLIMIALPLSTQFAKFDLEITTDLWMRFLLLSFEDRLINTWPEVFQLISQHGSYLLGRGIGGIGGAQSFFEKTIQNPADNLFLYLYVTFGVGAFFILYAFLKRTIILARADDTPLNVFFFLLSLSVITFGMTANVIEAPLYGYLIGVFFMFKYQVHYA